MRRPQTATIGLGALVAAAAGYWLWVGLSQRSIVEDDGISILAAQSILRHGIPELPSGLLYHRGYLPHYLLAGSLALFGSNDLGIMVPSLLLGLGVLCLVFRMGRDVARRPVAGLAAAALLTALQLETFYATSPRMYMALQFFSLLAAYCGWRGFVEGKRAFQWPTAAAIGAAILSHQQGGVLLGVLPAAVLAARRAGGASRARLPWRAALAGLAGLSVLFYLTAIHRPANALLVVPAPGATVMRHRDMNLDVHRWLLHAQELEGIVPLGILLAPVVVWAVLSAVRRRRPDRAGLVFLAVLVALNALAVMAATRSTYQRFWFYTLPAYALLLVLSAAAAREAWSARRWAAAGVVGGWVVLVCAVVAGSVEPARYGRRLRAAYGRPCLEGECMASTERAYRQVARGLAAEDLVVATNPWTASYYLGRVDGYLHEGRLADGRFVPFGYPTDAYFGAPIIDTAEELDALRAGPRRVWVVTDRKLERSTSPDTRGRLARDWTLALEQDRVRVYSNRAGGRASAQSANATAKRLDTRSW